MSPLVVTLAAASSGRERQQAVDDWLRAGALAAADPGSAAAADLRQAALIVEGPALGLRLPDALAVTRLPTGCVCCAGQVPLRVAVGRAARAMDRHQPRRILLLLAQGGHLARLRAQIERGELGAGVRLAQAP